jgi:diguanylate cyclase (GGDEF)-like protein
VTGGALAHARNLLTPPVFDDADKTTMAANGHHIALVLLVIVSPGLAMLRLAMPSVGQIMWVAIAVLSVSAVFLYVMSHLGRPTLGLEASLIGIWMMITWAAWVSGGIFSSAISAQFLVVAITEAAYGWRRSLPMSVLSVITIAGLVWAQVHGLVPPSMLVTTPANYGAAVVACLVALAIVQAMMGARTRWARDRVVLELQERKAVEQRLHDLIDHAPFGAFLCELAGKRNLRITHANRNASMVLGRDASRLVGGDLVDAFATSASRGLADQFLRVATRGDSVEPSEVPIFSNGTRRTLEVHAYQTEPGVIAVFFSDVTQARIAEAEIRQMAFHDELTKLPNRKLLLDRLEVAIEGAHRRGRGVGLLFIDLDKFKSLNDQYGHAFGDLVLAAVAQRLESVARASDTVARIGGDEFTLLMPDITGRDQVHVVACKLVSAFQEPFKVDGRLVTITASIGVSLTTEHDKGSDGLLERADSAMYGTKRAGRNGYSFG